MSRHTKLKRLEHPWTDRYWQLEVHTLHCASTGLAALFDWFHGLAKSDCGLNQKRLRTSDPNEQHTQATNHSNPARWLLDDRWIVKSYCDNVLLFDVDAVWNSCMMPSADSAMHMTTAFCLETVVACCCSSGNHCALQQLAQSGGLRTGRCALLYGCCQRVCFWARNYCCQHVGPWIPPELGSSKFHSCAKAHFTRIMSMIITYNYCINCYLSLLS